MCKLTDRQGDRAGRTKFGPSIGVRPERVNDILEEIRNIQHLNGNDRVCIVEIPSGKEVWDQIG